MQYDFFAPTNPLESYLKFLKEIRRMCHNRIQKNKLHITTIERELGKPVLEASTGSEIDQAILSASKKRKTTYNGGYQDDGLTYCNSVGDTIHLYFVWAQKEKLITYNIYPKNSFPEPPTREANCLSDEQLNILFNSKKLDFTEHVLVRFFYDTGLRIGDVTTIKLSDIDFKNQIVKVFMGKVQRPHTAPISRNTLTLLKKWLHGRTEGYLFPTKWGKKISTNSLRERFQKISKKVGFRCNPHSFRHAGVSQWTLKFGQLEGMKFAGHTSIQQTAHYIHMADQKKVSLQKELYKGRPVFHIPTTRTPKNRPKFILK